MSQPAELTVIARSPFKLYYEGPARVVSAANRVGPFDVLPGHTDFFSVMTPCGIVIEPGEGKEHINFEITNGIITVRDDQVVMFVNM
jgi:F0F1-type ATP synthase epsilon subunit